MASAIAKLILIGVFVVSIFSAINSIGRPRHPMRRDEATVTVGLLVVLIACVVLA